MGKTITCQRLVREVEQRLPAEADWPQPLYFDLRKLTGLRQGGVPTLERLVDECIQRGWATGADLPTAKELIARSRDHAQLWVFDGLDEALVHLTEVDGQAFTRELLRLQPLAGHGSHPHTRVLISCRTHFFRTLRDQNQHFTGQERDGASAADYRALLMLPLGEAQIRGYLQHALPDINADAMLELVRSVHNLGELAERPFTLKLIGEFIPQIEQWRAQGKPVFGVTLYRQMVRRWIDRDNGKHHLRPEHKERLMAHLAAWMWQRGQRSIEARELEPWFHAWLDSQPDLRLRYRDVGADKLEEDLRTATFLVREDGPDAGGFRFAHSSMQEFFLAAHLIEGVQRQERERWALPRVSRETLQFLAQLFMEQGSSSAALLNTLGDWRAPYLVQASEQWLAYALAAIEKGWPAPAMAGADLRGADLQGWHFKGRSEAAPLDLRGACFAGANLRETVWRDVGLDEADFQQADLARTEWWRVQAPVLNAEQSRVDGACFRQVQWPGSRWAGSSGVSPYFLLCEPPLPFRSGDGHAPGIPSALPPSQRLAWQLHAQGHSANACVFSPDGQRALSAGGGNTLKLWEVASGRCLATWRGHEGGVSSCAFSPDGRQALSAGWDGTLRLWAVSEQEGGRCLATWRGHEGWVMSCAFSPDGRQALSAGWDGTLRLWAVSEQEGGRCLSVHTPLPNGNAVVWSGDGRRLISASAEAWRWLSVQVQDADGEVQGLWPAERLVQLPFNA
jgi:WD domain, G-beta repeat/Pentapeptide repeats (8 copies)